ncbi:hypothetical protein M885DRAFT_566298 [Pelagophyceae sp. CCMP2097]|nr:hypothetical protein M885DRAFT_566298 [Pelagophyceae sp. CCMP2097]
MGSTDLKTHSEGHQGWLVSQHAETPVIDVTPSFHSKLARLKKARAGTHKGTLTRSAVIEALGAPRIASDRAQGWDAVCVLLVPGLWTKWYPFYFGALTETLKKLAIDFRVSKVDSDSTVERNAAVLSAELADLTLTRHVIIYAHSKGAIDVEQAIYAAPRSVRSNIAAFVSAQGPHGGSIVGNDVLGTQLQQGVVGFITERILGGSGRRAVTDLGYASRRAYYASRPETWWLKAAMPDARDWVPTVCLCGSATHQPRSLLSPIVEYYRYRYECAVDGLCAREDTALPGAPAVFVSDMDHFGPAWSGFPSTDRYDSVHIFFVMVAMALEHRAGVLVPRHTRARPASAQGGLSPDDADGDASYTDDCASTVHLSDGEASEADVLRLDGSAPPGGAEGEARLEAERSCKHAISRVASWGWFDAETMALDADAMSPKSPHSPHSPAKARPC